MSVLPPTTDVGAAHPSQHLAAGSPQMLMTGDIRATENGTPIGREWEARHRDHRGEIRCSAARQSHLQWTVRDLAERSGVDRNTVSNIETGAYAGAPETLEAIRRALERAGVEFTNGDAPGVRLRTKEVLPHKIK